jgi:ubiquinone/menaquinone biosynthesis C-methylase UbiE
MAKRLPRASIIGVEPEDLLRAKAEALVSSQGFAERCRFQKGTGERIPLEDGATDFSYARFLFQHLPEPLTTLREMRRVTRRGGIVVVLDVDDRTNMLYPAPAGLEELEQRIVEAQAAGGGDRHIGRKLHGYMFEAGLLEIGVEPIPITASMLGREAFFSIVYSFKRQVLERTGRLDEQDRALFSVLKEHIRNPATFASTTVYAAHGIVP